MASLGRDGKKPLFRPPHRRVDEGKKSAALNFLTGISLRAEGGAGGGEHAKPKPAGPLPAQRRPALHQYQEHAAPPHETGGGAASAVSQADGEPPMRPAQEKAGGAKSKKTGRNQARYHVSMKFLSNIKMSPSKTLTSLKSPFAASALSSKGEDAHGESAKPEQAEAHDSAPPGATPVADAAADRQADVAADRQADEPHLHAQKEDVDQRGQRGEGDSICGTEPDGGEQKKRGRVAGLKLVIPEAGGAAAQRPVSEGAQGRSKDFLSSISLGAQAREMSDGATDWAVPAGVASAGSQGEGLLQSPARSVWAGRSYSTASSPSLYPRLSSSASVVDDSALLSELSPAPPPPAPNSARSSLNEKIGHKFEGIMGSLGIKSGDRKRNQRPGSAARKAWKHAQLEWEQRQMHAFALVPSADKTRRCRTATLSPQFKPRAHAAAALPILERQRTSSLTTTPCGSLLELQGEADEGGGTGRWSARSSLSSDEMAPDLSKLGIKPPPLSPQPMHTSARPPSSSPHLPSADAAARGRCSPDETGGARRPSEEAASQHWRQARSTAASPPPAIAVPPRTQEREDGRRKRREAREQRRQRRREAKEAGVSRLGLAPGPSASAWSSDAAAAPPADMLCEVVLVTSHALRRAACTLLAGGRASGVWRALTTDARMWVGRAAIGQLGRALHLVVHASDELAAAHFALVPLARPLARSYLLPVLLVYASPRPQRPQWVALPGQARARRHLSSPCRHLLPRASPLPACCGVVMGGTWAADAGLAQATATDGGSMAAGLTLSAPISVVSVLKFKADDPPWMGGEPDEVARRPLATLCACLACEACEA